MASPAGRKAAAGNRPAQTAARRAERRLPALLQRGRRVARPGRGQVRRAGHSSAPDQRPARRRRAGDLCARAARGTGAGEPFWSGPTRACASWKGWPRPTPSLSTSKTLRTRLSATQFRLNGLLFHYDANAGQKTGAFLDQRTNYAAAGSGRRRLGADRPRAGRVLLPGRLCPAPGPGLPPGHGH